MTTSTTLRPRAPAWSCPPGGGVLLHPPGIVQGDSWPMIGAVWVMLIVSAAAFVSYLIARTELAMRQRIHLQAWSLGQLVPDDGRDPS